jgi:acyl-CoA thioester hydrolase
MEKKASPKEKYLFCTHRVSSYELDSFGHVNNAVFLNYLEKARCQYLTHRGISFNHFAQWQMFPVVTKAVLEYKAPAKADDCLHIKGWVAAHTAVSFTMKYEITNRETNKLILKGETVHVFINERNRPIRIPQEFYRKFIG